ncbi:mitochondrial import inner membrane translocase subunit Tim10 B [Siniperca chuatsi]|uniref:mitochondrial import inner membrane translocase subunit Tim10 B n=1 Tax=Siniperca chuatsi TaxID=119488 RepID=UPI001CE10BF6|nr:mitochondrial import inner membrane translocase subunit Tim10 B [Siniperca chuatsi]XP_044078594.1 mitochondrial import inner membrane translocase subunit Tim10 B [Siniperca chuatsi]
MDPDQQLRNLRDFLLVYNRMTEICFQRCSSNFNYRNLTMDEERCVDSCAGKLIRTNHRLMGTYVQLMPRMVQRRMEEMESKAAENAKAAEAAAASAYVGPSATEASPASQTPITSFPPPQVSPLLTPSIADVGPEAHGSVLKPAGLDIPVDLDAAVLKSTTATEVKLSAATTLTPATEAVNPSVLNEAGQSYSVGFPQPQIAGTQIESGSSAPVFMPSKSTSLSEDVPVSTVAAPTVSKSVESLPSHGRAPKFPPPSGQQ